MDRERRPQLSGTMSMSAAITVAAAMAAPIKIAVGRLVSIRIVTRHDQLLISNLISNNRDRGSAVVLKKRLTVDQRL